MDTERKFALLIDADNVSSRYIKYILDEISNYGTLTIKRIYGDWTSTTKQGWKDTLLEYSITPVQQYNYTTGKNSSDSAMIIDGMDILSSKDVDGFCIVSSDSDFTRLAARFRESGKMVIGMGEKKTPKPFISACSEFKYLEILVDEDEHESQIAINDITVIRKVIPDIINESGSNGMINLADLGNHLVKRFPDFDARNYGYTSLLKFVSTLSEFTIEKRKSVPFVKLKDFNKGEKSIEELIIEILGQAKKQTMNMGELNQKVMEKYPNFNLKALGYVKFSKFLNDLKGLDIENMNVKIKK
ncbi:MAG: NYN domain-containing protein [Bacilli bacterium]|nr:NYN domain-containing protein [Bacilli bacterium]